MNIAGDHRLAVIGWKKFYWNDLMAAHLVSPVA
jgi:hypothetical protein